MTIRARRPRLGAVLGAVVLLTALNAAAGAQSDPPAAATKPWHYAAGEIAYRNTETGESVGGETWDMTANADGSRTLHSVSHSDDNGTMQTVVLRVDADFRPREVFAQYWNKGTFRNTVFIAARDPLLDITSRFEQITTHSFVNVPRRMAFDLPLGFAFVTHPITADAWVIGAYNKDAGGAQEISVYALDNTAGDPPQTGALGTQTLTYVGPEPMNVPAGLFLCDHFRVNNAIDLYVTGPDAIFVKAVWPAQKIEYVLTKLQKTSAP